MLDLNLSSFRFLVSLTWVGLLGSLPCKANEIEIGLATQSHLKMEAVKDAFALLFPNSVSKISQYGVPSGVAEQPVTVESGLRGARNRLEAAKWISSIGPDYWISIENYITPLDLPLGSPSWKDQAVVIVQKKGKEPVVEYSRGVPFDSAFAEDAKKRTLSEYSFIDSGFSTTVGNSIAMEYQRRGEIVASEDWHQNRDFGGVSRKVLLLQAIARAILKSEIETVENFPKEGISFKDIVPILGNPDLYQAVVRFIAYKYQSLGIDSIAALEARGFLFGAPLAIEMKKPFIPIRKKGKLPKPTHAVRYVTEYSTDEIEISSSSMQGQTVLIVDDLLATGGTLRASEELIKSAGATQVYSLCLIELLQLDGREKLSSEFNSILKY